MKAICVNPAASSSAETSMLLVDTTLPDPQPKDYDLLVRVEAVAVNPLDLKASRAKPSATGQARVLGWDAAGAVGSAVTRFKPGDAVFYAGSIVRPGCCSELHLVDERLVGHKPNRLSSAQAAALPLASLAAWEALFDRMLIPRAEPELRVAGTLLVIGGAGGVGSMAVQLAAKLTDLRVVATASRSESCEHCFKMGAADVISHAQPMKEQLLQLGIKQVEYVLCLTDPTSLMKFLSDVVAPFGKICCLVESSVDLPMNLLRAKSISFSWEGMFTRSLFQTQDMGEQHVILEEISRLVSDGILQSNLRMESGKIDAANLMQAYRLIEEGHMIGKLTFAGF
jgi:NADPH2:quinone reductase